MLVITLLLGALSVAKEQPISSSNVNTASIIVLSVALLLLLIVLGYLIIKAGKHVGKKIDSNTEQLKSNKDSFESFRSEQKETNDTMKKFMQDAKEDSEKLHDIVFKQDAKIDENKKRLDKHEKIIKKHHPDVELG